jgi:hypothetical protein
MSHYDPATPGQYTSPTPPTPRKPKMPSWGIAVVIVAALVIVLVNAVVITRIHTARSAGDATPVISTSSPIPSTASTTETPRARQTEQAPDPAAQRTALYLTTVRNQYPQAVAITDQTLIGLAESACDVFKAGGTSADIFLALLDGPDADVENAKVLAYAVGAGVAAFCPQYQDQISGGY